MYVWDLVEGGCVAKLDPSTSCIFYIQVYLWDLVEGGCVAKLDHGTVGVVHSIEPHPSKGQLISGAGGTILVSKTFKDFSKLLKR